MTCDRITTEYYQTSRRLIDKARLIRDMRHQGSHHSMATLRDATHQDGATVGQGRTGRVRGRDLRPQLKEWGRDHQSAALMPWTRPAIWPCTWSHANWSPRRLGMVATLRWSYALGRSRHCSDPGWRSRTRESAVARWSRRAQRQRCSIGRCDHGRLPAVATAWSAAASCCRPIMRRVSVRVGSARRCCWLGRQGCAG